MILEDLIEALDQRYGNPLAKDCELIQEATQRLRILLRIEQEQDLTVSVHSQGNITSTKVKRES